MADSQARAPLDRAPAEDVVARRLLTILEAEQAAPESLSSLVTKLLGEEVPSEFQEVMTARLSLEILRSQPSQQKAWFAGFSWWLARLLMWGAFLSALIGVSIWGRSALEPLTAGLAGAAVYYVGIQTFGPSRMNRNLPGIAEAEKRARDRLKRFLEEWSARLTTKE